MAPHSSILAWKIPWTEEPGGLQSMGSLRVRHDWATSLSLFTFLHWRRKWQPTPVFLPGESHGLWSLVGCHLLGRTESDTMKRLSSSRSSSMVYLGFPGGTVVKNPPVNPGDAASISGSGTSPREGNGNPLQYSCLGNPMDRGAWWVKSPWGLKRVGQFKD